MERATGAPARHEREGHPPRSAGFAHAGERRYLLVRECPDRLAGGDRACERDVRVEIESLPGLEPCVVVARARDDLDRARARRTLEDDEARLRTHGLERLLEADVAHVEDGRCDRQRRRHLLEPARRVGAALGVGLGATSLHLLERQARLVGESADDRQGRLVGLGYDDLPRDREDELARSGDDHRRPERRPNPELSHEVEPLAVGRLQDVRHE